MFKTYTFDGVKLKGTKKLHLNSVIYCSNEEVIENDKITLSPKGTIINQL